jgi:hypothetical protein
MDVLQRSGRLDVALDVLRQGIAYLAHVPEVELPAKEREERLKFAQEGRIWTMQAPGGRQAQVVPEEIVAQQSNRWVIEAERLKSPLQKALLADRRYGLPGEALKILRGELGGTLADQQEQVAALKMRVQIELSCGRLEEAAQVLDYLPEAVDSRFLPAFQEDRFTVALLSGDFTTAGREWEALSAEPRARQAAELRPEWVKHLPPGVLLLANLPSTPFENALAKRLREVVWQQLLDGRLQILHAECDYLVRRGLLALDEGDSRTAEAYFRESLRPLGVEVVLAPQRIARTYLRAMGK